MANNRNLINAFDDCIERLITGEDLDDILKDYPDSADYLRDLLMIGERVSEIHNDNDETTSAQTRGRDKLQQVLKEKPKRKIVSRPRWYIPTVAVAGFMLIIGIGFLTLSLSSSSNPALDSTRTSIAFFNSTTESLIHATQVQATQNIQSTQVAYLVTTATQQSTALPPTIQPAMSAVYIPTSVASMAEATAEPPIYGTGDPDFPALTASAQDQLYAQMTATHLPALWATTPTSEMYGISAVQAAQTTATALANVFASTPMSSDLPLTTGGGDSLPETGGGGDSGGGSYGVEDAIKTTSFPEPLATTTPVPTITMMPAGTQVADGSLIIPSQSNDSPPTPLPALIPLNAGEIDDNDEWDTYLLYRREFLQRGFSVYDSDVTGRWMIRVVDETGQPILGAKVSIFANDTLIAESLTFATGRTMFFPNADERSRTVDSFMVTVEKDGFSRQFTVDRNQSSEWQVTLPLTVNHDAVQVDVLFLIDTTGSMSDEIRQLQNNILHISSQLNSLGTNLSVRYGLVAYRDFTDAYVTQISPFVVDVTEFQTTLNQLEAQGGGDTPEALNTALDATLNQMDWHGENTIKLIFLVADAAPHINHPLEPITYDQSIQDALARGIKIHPIASSGLEPAGEYIFRQIAQVTMGHFLFLTYDNGVAGTVGDTRPELDVGLPETLDPIGGYTVDRLADVVLRLIQDEILIYRGIIQP